MQITQYQNIVIYLWINNFWQHTNGCFITTFDFRFKVPNNGKYLSNSTIHSLEHLIATYYSKYKQKLYFGPMGCQTGFYLIVYGKKDINWIKQTLSGLDRYINSVKSIPAKDKFSCGHFANLSLFIAKKEWNNWYKQRNNWTWKY